MPWTQMRRAKNSQASFSFCCPQGHSQKRNLQIGRRSATGFELCPSSVRRAVTSGHVSGVGAGIVLALAEAFVEAGTNVAIWYHSNKQDKESVASIAEKASNQPQPSAQEQPLLCFDQETFAELRANVSSDRWEMFAKRGIKDVWHMPLPVVLQQTRPSKRGREIYADQE